ncbi:hypothetical protein SAMN05421544_10470 [Riemerella columbipharyngis]|uniref:Uncharacterized protein n=1 Tax=Riemerella columbipharyngis TaxID=1071918 RepID=A0A1G7AR98_9FLAO|nr:hypothetical protein SAMN05421544_10470 [Riemerella columbipharyngis]
MSSFKYTDVSEYKFILSQIISKKMRTFTTNLKTGKVIQAMCYDSNDFLVSLNNKNRSCFPKYDIQIHPKLM